MAVLYGQISESAIMAETARSLSRRREKVRFSHPCRPRLVFVPEARYGTGPETTSPPPKSRRYGRLMPGLGCQLDCAGSRSLPRRSFVSVRRKRHHAAITTVIGRL
jgi:hypothetical protein